MACCLHSYNGHGATNCTGAQCRTSLTCQIVCRFNRINRLRLPEMSVQFSYLGHCGLSVEVVLVSLEFIGTSGFPSWSMPANGRFCGPSMPAPVRQGPVS